MPDATPNVRDDLRGLLRGEVLFDELSRALYSSDASPFRVQPLGVVVPHDEEDVCALVRYAAEQQVPLTARGAGSNVSGAALGEGLIVDFSTHQRAILDIGADTVTLQPGVVLRELNAELAQRGRRFAAGPTTGEATVGGVLAANRSGARALLAGYPRDHLVSLRVVLDTGDAVTLRPQSRFAVAEGPARQADLAASVATLLEQQAALLAAPVKELFDRCGYRLDGVLVGDTIDLARLIVGSEGTLALITEATLRTQPLPAGEAVLLASFPSQETALAAMEVIRPLRPAACDLLDRRLLSLIRTVAELPVPAVAEAVLLIELEAETVALARQQAVQLCEALLSHHGRAVRLVEGLEPEDRERLRQVRAAVLPALSRLGGRVRPVAVVEDVAVPPAQLRAYLEGARRALQDRDVTAAFLVHACTAQVECWPFVDVSRREEVARLHDLADALYRLAWGLGGTISSQHGCGLARTPWVSRQVGRLYPVFRDLKAIFDPRHLFNPGQIISPRGGPRPWPFRVPERIEEGETILPHPALHGPPRPLTLRLHDDAEQARQESQRCHGCGDCRTASPSLRMCPIFRATHAEPASPRAKANLWRVLAEGPDGLARLAAPEARALADLCVNCKMCQRECPAEVPVARLMLEAKALNVAEHGLDRSDWVLARTESFARLGSAFAPLVNRLLGNRSVRWLMEKLFGVSRRRRLPAFAGISFLRRAARRGWTRRPSSLPNPGRPRVAYFVDVFANYNDPLIAESVVAVLHHNGIEVYVPPGQRGCGMAPLAVGDAETARETVLRNLRLLADLVRQGYLVLCSEPTAALMLTQDALDLLDDADAELVAQHTVELTAYLWRLYQEGTLRTDFRTLELSLGHHVPCHLKALGGQPAGPALLSLIPGLRVTTIDVSCSGMAGTYGLKAAHHATSLEAGRPMLEQLARPGLLFGSTECSACRLQMEEGTGKRTLHPAQYLALAYGLVPRNAERLREPIRELLL